MTLITRDGALLWVLAVAALAGYLLSVPLPPTQWDYHQWLQFAAAVAAWGIGKLQTSPAPSKAEVAATDLGSIAPGRKDLP